VAIKPNNTAVAVVWVSRRIRRFSFDTSAISRGQVLDCHISGA
jgi:hypothetical protein